MASLPGSLLVKNLLVTDIYCISTDKTIPKFTEKFKSNKHPLLETALLIMPSISQQLGNTFYCQMFKNRPTHFALLPCVQHSAKVITKQLQNVTEGEIVTSRRCDDNKQMLDVGDVLEQVRSSEVEVADGEVAWGKDVENELGFL